MIINLTPKENESVLGIISRLKVSLDMDERLIKSESNLKEDEMNLLKRIIQKKEETIKILEGLVE